MDLSRCASDSRLRVLAEQVSSPVRVSTRTAILDGYTNRSSMSAPAVLREDGRGLDVSGAIFRIRAAGAGAKAEGRRRRAPKPRLEAAQKVPTGMILATLLSSERSRHAEQDSGQRRHDRLAQDTAPRHVRPLSRWTSAFAPGVLAAGLKNLQVEGASEDRTAVRRAGQLGVCSAWMRCTTDGCLPFTKPVRSNMSRMKNSRFLR
jgi:hypothetical protein